MVISRSIIAGALVLGSAAIMACGSEDGTSSDLSATEVRGPTMRPGENCLRCHSETGGVGAPVWSAAGTVFTRKDADRGEGVEGATVTITDADGRVVTLVSNSVGNFYTAETLAKPYRITLTHEGRTIRMPIAAPAGSCNACHSWPDRSGGAPGRIFVP